ncbi:sensor domain-containing diguanylate cyclase [Rummeliibacillus pycnus]|uniref:sensor domain-containing diguanylate cyclase n=1 Tax=Rummeliibacillus pycnus TaxID=101070 RepID=UPI003D28DF23
MKKYHLKLQHLIIGVAILAFMLTIVSSLLSSYRMNNQTLMDNTLETNRVYAEKLATTANNYLNETLQTLTVNANSIAEHMDNEKQLLTEADRLKNQSNTFNSISILDAKGKVLATSPQTIGIKGKTLTSNAVKTAIKEKKPMISDPYRAITNRELIYISAPIFNKTGKYVGLVGGTIYLEEQNILYELLGKHFYNDGSYVYVVDRNGRIIYHQNRNRINNVVKENPVVQKIMNQNDGGAQRVTNSEGKDMLAGYALVENTGWGVVSQRPTEISLQPAENMVKEMLYLALPLLIITLVIIIWAAIRISRPLQQLAELTESSMKKDEQKNLSAVQAWYYEAIQLKNALIQSLSFLHQQVNFFMDQSTTDPLTGLTNRRTLNAKMDELITAKTPFSMILMDIDRFKLVNDTYGHGVGDEVLQYLAYKMKATTRATDLCCRYGGEEFIVLLPNTSAQDAFEIADILRKDLENTISPTGEAITISAGVAEYPETEKTPTKLIEQADQCLYQAKEQGRNRIIMAKSLNPTI